MHSLTLDFQRHPMLRFRIDSVTVPAGARQDFDAAMRRNFAFIQTLSGFLGHVVFEKVSGPSHVNLITLAAWESPEAIEHAKQAVREYYKQIGFDPAEATARWGVAAEIGEYGALDELPQAGRSGIEAEDG